MTAASPVVWGHALAALLFGALALAQLRNAPGNSRSTPFMIALALTGLWALAVAGIGSRDVSVRIVEPLRDAAWLVAMFAALRRDARPGLAITATYGVIVAVAAASVVVAVTSGEALDPAAVLLRMMTSVAALVLAHHLAAAAPASRGGLRLALVALAAMWTIDLLIYATTYAVGAWPVTLVAGRGFAVAVVGATLAVAAHRRGDWTLQPSRMIAIRSLSLAAIAVYVVAVVLATGLFANVGGDYARLLQTAFVAGATATLIGIVASPWLRAWVKVKVAKHLFGHRYDYRHEWLRFTATLARPDADTDPLEQRVVQALANLTDSPSGLLLIAQGEGLSAAAAWNWVGTGPVEAAFATHLAASDQIVDLDTLRSELATPGSLPADAPPTPQWLLHRLDAWAVVPLIHHGHLAGAVVLARPPVARPLDWEDFDLLRVAGRQGASYLAEGRTAAALGEAQRFDEFNRRFAFIIHDVKNLVSQLTLVAHNAERHADNPAFRADMIATLQDSCARMSALLQRLSQHSGSRADPPRATDVGAIAHRLARQRRGQHQVVVTGDSAVALVDPTRFEQILGHLVQNAIEASRPNAPVAIAIAGGADGVTVAVVDTGAGMSAAFVRDELFRPFASSKSGGFGIGAFEARQLTEAMAGRIVVTSEPGRGTRFAITFPAAPALEVAA